jgi:hypothetical protein
MRKMSHKRKKRAWVGSGYVSYWQPTKGAGCEPTAPTWVSVEVGERVKTDRRAPGGVSCTVKSLEWVKRDVTRRSEAGTRFAHFPGHESPPTDRHTLPGVVFDLTH